MFANSLFPILIVTKLSVANTKQGISDMAKVQIKSGKLTPFGENYSMNGTFCALSLYKVSNGTLGML